MREKILGLIAIILPIGLICFVLYFIMCNRESSSQTEVTSSLQVMTVTNTINFATPIPNPDPQNSNTPLLVATPNTVSTTTFISVTEQNLYSPSSWLTQVETASSIASTFLPYVLLIIAIFVIGIYGRGIGDLIDRAVSHANHINILGIELTFSEVSVAIKEREILKYAIFMAMSDGKPSPEELRFLSRVARGMTETLENLSFYSDEIIERSIEMVFSDGELQDSEYRELKKIVRKFEISEEELDKRLLEVAGRQFRSGILLVFKTEKDSSNSSSLSLSDKFNNQCLEVAHKLNDPSISENIIAKIIENKLRKNPIVDEKFRKEIIEISEKLNLYKDEVSTINKMILNRSILLYKQGYDIEILIKDLNKEYQKEKDDI